MKKSIAALFLVFIMISSLLAGCTTNPQTEESSSLGSEQSTETPKDVILRFAAMSDVHFSGDVNQTERKRFEKAMDFMYEYSSKQDYKKFDLLLVAGDMTNNGYENQIQSFADAVKNKLKDGTTKFFVMGNHEYYNNDTPAVAQTRWESIVGVSKNTHTVVNGYHFIGVSLGNTEDYTYAVNWLDEELAKAAADDPKKPIFVTQHFHISNTVYGSDDWGTPQLTNVLKKYPQVVDLSGHSHYPVNDPRSIHQGDFTSLGTGTLSYFELEKGMSYGTIPPNANNAAQFYVVEVYSDNSVAFKPYDLITDQFFPNEYKITNPSDKSGFVYTNARADKADKPVFASDAKVTVSDINDSSCTLTFPQATDGENIHSYRFDFFTKSDNTKVMSFKIWSDFYFLNTPKTMSYTPTGLTSGTEYKVTVTAIDSYGKESERPLEVELKTTGEAPEPVDPNAPLPDADILDVVISKDGAKDNGSLKKTVENLGAKFVADNSLGGAYVASFSGSNEYLRIKFTGEDYSKYNQKITLACKFKLNSFSDPYSDVFANMQSGGYGFEINKASGKLEFWLSIGGSYKVIDTPIETGKYYTVAGTYDGSAVKLYVNGELKASGTASGKITYTTVTQAYAFCVGSDIGSSGSGEAFFNGSVAFAKAYSIPLSAEQVKKLSE